MVTNYQHKKIRRFAMLIGFFFGLYIGLFIGQALTLRSIQRVQNAEAHSVSVELQAGREA